MVEMDSSGIELLRMGMLYANLHSKAYPAGEIRGQVQPANNRAPSMGFAITAPDSGANITIMDDASMPFVPMWEAATDPDMDTLVYTWQLATSMSFETVIFEAFTGKATMLEANMAIVDSILFANGVMEGNSITLYHRAMASDGVFHVPGQSASVTLNNGEPTTIYEATLSGVQEVPSVMTMGAGDVRAELTGDNLAISGNYDNLSSKITMAHIHIGKAGENGPVLFGLNLSLNEDSTSGSFESADNLFTLTEGQIDTLKMGGYYVNIHTENFPAGELRGQVMMQGDQKYYTVLSSKNAIPGNNSDAMGALSFSLDGMMLQYSGTFMDLEGEYDISIAGGTHLHQGGPAETGGIIERIPATMFAMDSLSGSFSGIVEMDSSGIELLRMGMLYANLHSKAYPAGEIRGQVLPADNMAPSMDFAITAPASGARITIMDDASMPFEPMWEMSMDPNMDTVVYTWQLATSKSFETVIFEAFTGKATMLEANMAIVDSILVANGVDEGEVITLYHRAVASDGVFHVPGQPASVRLSNGETVNNMPSADFDIVSPEDGAEITIMDDASMPFVPMWEQSMDMDGDELTYAWQLATSNDFDNIIFEASTGMDTMLNANMAIVDSILVANGVMEGSSITLYHRAVAFDGEDSVAGNSASVVLNNGEMMNNAPSGDFDITAPADGAEITIIDDASMPFVPMWEASSDADGDELTYTWQLATSDVFDQIIFSAPTGTATMLEANMAIVDSILVANGVAEGSSITLYHRAVVTDGMDTVPGNSASVTLRNGEPIANGIATSNFNNLKFYPNPSSGLVNVEIGQYAQGIVTIRAINGRILDRIEINGSDFKLNLPEQAGLYIVTIQSQEGNAQLKITRR
jgi:Fe2+ transport system protein FeoA